MATGSLASRYSPLGRTYGSRVTTDEIRPIRRVPSLTDQPPLTSCGVTDGSARAGDVSTSPDPDLPSSDQEPGPWVTPRPRRQSQRQPQRQPWRRPWPLPGCGERSYRALSSGSDGPGAADVSSLAEATKMRRPCTSSRRGRRLGVLGPLSVTPSTHTDTRRATTDVRVFGWTDSTLDRAAGTVVAPGTRPAAGAPSTPLLESLALCPFRVQAPARSHAPARTPVPTVRPTAATNCPPGHRDRDPAPPRQPVGALQPATCASEATSDHVGQRQIPPAGRYRTCPQQDTAIAVAAAARP